MIKVLIGLTLLKLCKGGNGEIGNSKNEFSPSNSTKVVRVFEDSVAMVQKKNDSDSNDGDDNLDNYLRDYVIRIKSPSKGDKFYEFEMKDLISDNKLEGRARRKEFKNILLPLLVALKLKSTILIPIFLAFVALIAFKGFWAGMTALFVSKAVALKVFYNTDNRRDRHRFDFDDDHDDYEDYEEFHRYRDHYDDHRYYRTPHGNYNNPKGRPIVIYLNDRSKPYDGYPEDIPRKEHDQDTWDSWRREYLNWDGQKWEPSSSFSGH